MHKCTTPAYPTLTQNIFIIMLLCFFGNMPPLKRTLTIADEMPRKDRRTYKQGTKTRTKVRKAFKSVNSSDPKAVSMPYHDYRKLTLGGGSGTIGHLVFRGNDVFDPQYSLGGHQAFGFDQLTPLYKKFYVMSSTIKVQTTHNTNNASYGQILVWADTDPNAPPDIATACERSAANGGSTLMGQMYSANISTVTKKATTKKLLSSGMSEDNNHGSGAASPLEEWFWHVVITLEDPVETRIWPVMTDIMYDTIWTESKLNIGS